MLDASLLFFESFFLFTSDFTLAEFANADPAVSKTGRMKKGSVNAIKQNGKFFLFLVVAIS